MLPNRVDNSLHSSTEFWIIKLLQYAERKRKIRRTDDCGIDSFDRNNFINIFYSFLCFDLYTEKEFVVCGRHVFGIVKGGSSWTVAAQTFGRILDRLNGLGGFFS